MPSGEGCSLGVHGPRPKRTAAQAALCPPVAPEVPLWPPAAIAGAVRARGAARPRTGMPFPGVQGAADIGDAPGSPDTGPGCPKAADRSSSCSVPQLPARITRSARPPPARPERECTARSWVMAPPYPVIRLR
ncbi:hypothetical protein GCM10010191_41230 [Actinomadura vinacea]|uniref:Uncharacterized protein n=1 Tax=Actinomadura vinacea TaxID=115336 RepID=A0ABN3J8W5_9ACTN